MNERRHDPRYSAMPNLLLVLRSQPVRLGTVKDISGSGISFEFAYATPWREDHDEIKWVDILDFHSDFLLSKLPCKVIYNTEGGNGEMPTMRCGLQFDDLTEEQKEGLNYIIKHYTTESAEGNETPPEAGDEKRAVATMR